MKRNKRATEQERAGEGPLLEFKRSRSERAKARSSNSKMKCYLIHPHDPRPIEVLIVGIKLENIEERVSYLGSEEEEYYGYDLSCHFEFELGECPNPRLEEYLHSSPQEEPLEIRFYLEFPSGDCSEGLMEVTRYMVMRRPSRIRKWRYYGIGTAVRLGETGLEATP